MTGTCPRSRRVGPGSARALPGRGRRGADGVEGRRVRPPAEPAAAGAEGWRRRGRLAGGRQRGGLRGQAAAVPVLVRRRARGSRLRRAVSLLLLPARGHRDAGVAGGARRPARGCRPDEPRAWLGRTSRGWDAADMAGARRAGCGRRGWAQPSWRAKRARAAARMTVPSSRRAATWGQRTSRPTPFRNTPRRMTTK